VHLAIVTVGILIALSFEGTRQWYEHREQVAEARRNLLEEVRGNKEALEKNFLAKVAVTRQDMAHAATFAQSLLDGNTGAGLFWKLDYPLTSLQSASFATAQATGAFALMEYEEARRFSSIYRMQETFERQHEMGLTTATEFYGMGQMIGAAVKSRTKARPTEVEEWRRRISTVDTSILLQGQLGGALDKAYQSLLGETPTPEPAARH
jgi:hypothetical protein